MMSVYMSIILFIVCILQLLNATIHSQSKTKNNSMIQFTLKTTKTWKEFPLKLPSNKKIQDKWVMVGAITLKRTVIIKLSNLKAKWSGSKINQLCASLYTKKESIANIIPIEDNLICDGTWNNKKQEFTFNINKKIAGIDTYYLVLSFPKNAESKLKKGNFLISNDQHQSKLLMQK